MEKDYLEAEQQAYNNILKGILENRSEDVVALDVETTDEETQLNTDLYQIGLLGNEVTLDEVVFKVNEIISYINKNIGVYNGKE